MEIKFSDVVKSPTNIFDEFIGACLVSSVMAHSAHFETKSYEKHVAFEYFYDEMPDKIDTFAETYMASGFNYAPMLKIPNVDFTGFVKRLAELAEEVATKSPNGVLKNAADDIQQLCRLTLYKLSLS
ncbi:hypothetical protein JNMOADIG_00120 [Aeromonas phage avDM5]|uniref:Uncharacterized protein n=1 Tax=Aeromonas phage vB_AehM_DM2 TaxID=2973716 RepID=A0AA94YTZ1_9CAUD|nr:hypothetical protein JNMOADIG_00120 [Aeromonas phage avDM5]UYD60377.1 hypothetical protein NPHMPGLK_00042 [Aeromonas phage avDM2]UYD60787.1 hypothetical protein NHNEHLNL_00191 [Aeromonas phage avDM2]